MKKITYFILSISLIVSCTEKDDDIIDSELIGKWNLIEMLVDPGDGSGIFLPVTSDKVIEFHANGTVSSNGLICSMSIDSDDPSTGTFSLVDSTITSPDCTNSPLSITFEVTGSTLIINYPCIEACRAKYIKD